MNISVNKTLLLCALLALAVALLCAGWTWGGDDAASLVAASWNS